MKAKAVPRALQVALHNRQRDISQFDLLHKNASLLWLARTPSAGAWRHGIAEDLSSPPCPWLRGSRLESGVTIQYGIPVSPGCLFGKI
jgi:hypothetical protein